MNLKGTVYIQEMERQVHIVWGPMATGKSVRVRKAVGSDAYYKHPDTPFWDGYKGQKHVVIDSFFGQVAFTEMLHWIDNETVSVKVKDNIGNIEFNPEKIWIISPCHPDDWYPDISLSQHTKFLTRLTTCTMHYMDIRLAKDTDIVKAIVERSSGGQLKKGVEVLFVYCDNVKVLELCMYLDNVFVPFVNEEYITTQYYGAGPELLPQWRCETCSRVQTSPWLCDNCDPQSSDMRKLDGFMFDEDTLQYFVEDVLETHTKEYSTKQADKVYTVETIGYLDLKRKLIN